LYENGLITVTFLYYSWSGWSITEVEGERVRLPRSLAGNKLFFLLSLSIILCSSGKNPGITHTTE